MLKTTRLSSDGALLTEQDLDTEGPETWYLSLRPTIPDEVDMCQWGRFRVENLVEQHAAPNTW